MSDIIAIQTTTGSRHDAQQLAAALVDQRLAACVQITGPIESTYRWQGKLETSEEWLLTIKTRRERFADVERVILAMHSYEQPEIVAFPATAATAGYERWLLEQTQE